VYLVALLDGMEGSDTLFPTREQRREALALVSMQFEQNEARVPGGTAIHTLDLLHMVHDLAPTMLARLHPDLSPEQQTALLIDLQQGTIFHDIGKSGYPRADHLMLLFMKSPAEIMQSVVKPEGSYSYEEWGAVRLAEVLGHLKLAVETTKNVHTGKYTMELRLIEALEHLVHSRPKDGHPRIETMRELFDSHSLWTQRLLDEAGIQNERVLDIARGHHLLEFLANPEYRGYCPDDAELERHTSDLPSLDCQIMLEIIDKYQSNAIRTAGLNRHSPDGTPLLVRDHRKESNQTKTAALAFVESKIAQAEAAVTTTDQTPKGQHSRIILTRYRTVLNCLRTVLLPEGPVV